MKFSVTFEIVTPEYAEMGDAEERGFIGESLTLREAFEAVNGTRTSRVDCVQSVEPSEWPCVAPSWATVTNGMEYETGAYESRSIHFPESLTPSTRRRICRALGVNV